MADAKLDTQIRREQIAEAAMSLVANHGLRRFSIAAIARRVGIVPSGIYRHFKNKDEILAAMLDRIEVRLTNNVRKAREESTDSVEQLQGVLTRHIRMIREGKVISVPRVIFSEDLYAGNQKRKERVLQILTHYVGQVVDIVKEGQAAGRIRRELDPQTISLMLFGIIVPAGILWHLTEGGFDVTRHAQRAWQLLQLAVVDPAEPLGRSRSE